MLEEAGLPEGTDVAEGWAGALVAGTAAVTGAAGSGAGLADVGPGLPEPVLVESLPVELAAAEPVPAEPVPVELAAVLAGEPEAPEVADEPVEPVGDVAEPADEVADDVAEPTAEVTGDVAEPTVVVTGDAAELTGDVVPERVDVRVALTGGRAAVDAWAGRENSSMTTKMPAATSAACTATRAMRRAVGCMSSSHSTTDQAARLPSGGGANHAHTELLFGHHRTV